MWTGNYANDPYNDFALLIEMFYDEYNVGIIRQEKNGVSLRWFSYEKKLIVPFEWLFKLVDEMVYLAQQENESQGLSNDSYKDGYIEFNYPLYLILSGDLVDEKLEREDWEANFIDDSKLSLCLNNKEAAFIKRENGVLALTIYPHDKILFIPFDWLFGIMKDIQKGLKLVEKV
jgi:hypothetical protein